MTTTHEVPDFINTVLTDVRCFETVQKLKFTTRYSGRTFDGKTESVADHTWCCLVIAKYLLLKLEEICPGKYDLDELKVYQLLIYHDLLEAYTGDVDQHPSDSERQRTKTQVETEALPIFCDMIPQTLTAFFQGVLSEYEQKQTLASLFGHLVDVVEAEFQVFFHKEFFQGWTEAYFIEKREKHFKPFPELMYIFNEVLAYYRNNGYFSQSE